MPDGVIGNTPEFESDIPSSNLGPVTNGGCSLLGKVPDCASGEQGSNPAAYPEKSFWFIVQWIRILRYERRDESSILSKPTMV